MTFWAFTTLLNVHLGFLQIIIITMTNGSHCHPVLMLFLSSTPVLFQHGGKKQNIDDSPKLRSGVIATSVIVCSGVAHGESKLPGKVFI